MYEKGNVRIHYEEAGSGFPLLIIPGGGLNSTVEGLKTHPFNPLTELSNEFRVIAADLRKARPKPTDFANCARIPVQLGVRSAERLRYGFQLVSST